MEEDARYRWIAEHILPHEREVRGWLRRHVHSLSAHQVSDIVQEAYARVWLADFEQIADGRAYFYAIVRNLVADLSRRNHAVPMQPLANAEHCASPEPGPERYVSAAQELDRMLQVISTLPPQCRRAFELRKFSGWPVRDIAREMKVSEGTVEKHLAKALARILAAIAH